MLLPLAAALLLTPPGTPAGGFHWQRIITPPPGAAAQEACVVLDAATFANAAPALRDLRLFQDGNELAYVIEESYDERALNSGVTPQDDRSEYEPVSVAPLVAGAASLDLPAHVPVERIAFAAPRLEGLLYTVRVPVPGTGTVEQVQGAVPEGSSTAPLTLGANLQHATTVQVRVAPSGASTRATLQMRRRSLCYEPRSANPLVLYLGGGEGIAAKTYSLSSGFSTALERPYATMGPLEPNPDQQSAAQHHLPRLLVAIAVLAVALLLTAILAATLLRKEKGRRKAAPST